MKSLVLITGLMLAAPNMSHQDPYATCAFYHWSALDFARKTSDLEGIDKHLAALDDLAVQLAVERRISRDGAHAILRRGAEAIHLYQGSDLGSMGRASEACGTVTSRR